MLPLIVLATGIAGTQPCPPSAPTQRLDLLADQAGGLPDRSRFAEAQGSATVPFLNVQQVRPRQGPQGPLFPTLVRSLVETAMSDFVSDVEARSGRTYPQRNLIADFVDLWLNHNPAYHGRRDVYITRIVEEISCVDARVTIRVFGVYATVPRIVDPAVVAGAVRAMDRSGLVSTEPDGHGGENITINVYNFLDQARLNPAVRNELKAGVDRFLRQPQSAERMRLADDYSRSLVEQVSEHGRITVAGFESGQVGISSFMAGVIESLVLPELALALRRSEGTVRVVAVGHTDRNTVISPIEYHDCAQLARPAGEIVRYTTQSPSECPERRITNNDQLSFARGHAGTALLARVFPPNLPQRRVWLGYSGLGTAESSSNRAASRRVVYRILVQRLRESPRGH